MNIYCFPRVIIAFLAMTACFPVCASDASSAAPIADILQLYAEHSDRFDPSHSNTADYLSGKTPLALQFCDRNSPAHTCSQPERILKLEGQKTEFVKMVPSIPGEWRFQSDYSLTFQPSEPWRPQTVYHLTFKPDLFPPYVHLDPAQDAFESAPLYLLSKHMDYLQDPNQPDRKLVTLQLTFNYPVDRASLEQSLAFTLESSASSQPFTESFSQEDTQVNVTVSVEDLQKSAQFLRVQIQNSLKAAGDSHTLTPHRKKDGTPVDNEFSERVMIPSLYDYLQIRKVEPQIVKDAHYIPRQTLVFESNSAIAPADLKRCVELRLLPEAKDVPGMPSTPHYAWSSPDEVTPELRSTLPKIAAQPDMDAESDASPVNGINFTADGGRYLLVTVKKSLPGAGGYQLGKDSETIVQVPTLPQEVRVMSDGGILSLSGEKTLSILSLGVAKLEYKVGQVKEMDLNHLISQTSGSFAHPVFNYSFDETNISEIFHEERTLPSPDLHSPQYSSFDFSPYLGKNKGLFFLNVKGKDATEKTPQEAKEKPHAPKHYHRHPDVPEQGSDDTAASDNRFILITDLGLTVKGNLDGTRDLFTQSLARGGPVGKVRIDVLGLNGNVIAKYRDR